MHRFLAVLAVLGLLAAMVLSLAAAVTFRAALAAKIGRAQDLERAAVRPAAAARLASALLEQRFTSAAAGPLGAAFTHANAGRAIADYRAAGGDPSILAEAEKSLQEKAAGGSDVAWLRAIRLLRAEAESTPRVTPLSPPASARRAELLLLVAAAAALAAAVLAYGAGRTSA